MSLKWEIIKNDTDDIWESILRQSSTATFFQTRSWADLFTKTFPRWKTDPVVIEYSDGNQVVLYPAQLLIVTAIEKACKEGYRWFDLMGPNTHLKGLQHFKDGFATQQLPYDAYYSNNSIQGLLFIRYQKFKEKTLRRCKM